MYINMGVCISIALVEQAYHPDNCYHNNTHAADVTQALHCLLSERKVISVLYLELDILEKHPVNSNYICYRFMNV